MGVGNLGPSLSIQILTCVRNPFNLDLSPANHLIDGILTGWWLYVLSFALSASWLVVSCCIISLIYAPSESLLVVVALPMLVS